MSDKPRSPARYNNPRKGKNATGSDVFQRPVKPLFKIIGKLDGAIDHANDLEIKILEHLARQLKDTSEGVINLYSERPPCKSCEKVIEQFEKMFPKVKVNVTSE